MNFVSREQRIDFLLSYFRSELPSFERFLPPRLTTYSEKRRALAALVSFFGTKKAPEEVVSALDGILLEESRERGWVSAYSLPVSGLAKVAVYEGDILRLQVDAIVDSASPTLEGSKVPFGTSLDAQIHQACGLSLLEELAPYRNALRGSLAAPGKALLTKARNIPASYVIHTIAPKVGVRPSRKDETDLKYCYWSSLRLAEEAGLKTIAFPALGTGGNRYPKKEAARIAVDAVDTYLNRHDTAPVVVFALVDKEDSEIYGELLQ